MLALGAIMANWTSPSLLAGEPAGDNTTEQVIADELKSLEDPTILKRRVRLETEWNSYRDGSDNVEETLVGLWAWPISARQDWAVRLKLPYEWHFAGNNSGDSDENGLGDIKMATGMAYRLNDAWRVGGGLELRMPTAQNDLGDNVWKLQEFGTLAWDATKWLSLTPTVEYNESLCEENDASPQHNAELFFPATFILPHRWSITTRYEAKIDFENDNYVTQSGKLYLSKSFAKIPVGLTASIKKPFNTANKDYQVNFVIDMVLASRRSSDQLSG